MKDSDQIKVASNGGIYLAPYASIDPEKDLPTDVTTELAAAFTEVGYVGDDGVTFTKSEEVEDIRAWQSQNPVRRIVVSRDFSAAGSLEQFSRENVAAAMGGGTWTEPKAGVFRFDPPADADPLAEWVAVIEAIDGDRIDRWVIERCNITGDVETQAVRNAAMMLPITLSALTPDDKDKAWYYLSNDPAFVASS